MIEPAVKLIAMLKRKPGISMQEFEEYYETNHVPLVLRLVPHIADYRRNYVQQDSALSSMDGIDADCDVITEAWFETEEQFARFVEAGSRPEIREQIIRDELNFLDRDSIRMVLVTERRTDIQRGG